MYLTRRQFFGALGLGAIGLSLIGCQSESAEVEVLKSYPYDFSNLSIEGDRATFSQEGNIVSEQGIDVSYLQKEIDWSAVVADGIDFAFIRLGYRGNTEGMLYVDDYFEANLAGAAAAGLKVGVYFFSQAISMTEATEEAQFCVDNLGGVALDLPIVFDHEPTANNTGRADNVSSEDMSAIYRAFSATLANNGYATMIYGNAGDLARFDEHLLENEDIWFAQYDVDYPTSYLNYSIWQYTNGGSVAGIDTNVDMNIRFIAS